MPLLRPASSVTSQFAATDRGTFSVYGITLWAVTLERTGDAVESVVTASLTVLPLETCWTFAIARDRVARSAVLALT